MYLVLKPSYNSSNVLQIRRGIAHSASISTWLSACLRCYSIVEYLFLTMFYWTRENEMNAGEDLEDGKGLVLVSCTNGHIETEMESICKRKEARITSVWKESTASSNVRSRKASRWYVPSSPTLANTQPPPWDTWLRRRALPNFAQSPVERRFRLVLFRPGLANSPGFGLAQGGSGLLKSRAKPKAPLKAWPWLGFG